MKLTKEYLKGFNSGYLLRKHKPMLMKELEDGIKPTSPYVQGLLDGNKEYGRELDRKLERVQQKSRENTKEKGRGLGM